MSACNTEDKLHSLDITAELRKDVHVLHPAEEMKEHRGISYNLLICPDVRMKTGIIQSLATLLMAGHRCAVTVAGVISAMALITQVLTPHPRPAAFANLNCNELINPGCYSRFRHLLSDGGDYSSSYSYSCIILNGCCCHNVMTSSKMTY